MAFDFEGKPVLESAQPLALSSWRKLGWVAGLTAALLAPTVLQARLPTSDTAVVSLAELPKEARTTQRLIRSGGPFPYRKDGSVFGNRERLLPLNHRGHYREYTVPTPGSRDRGAKRIVCGGKAPTSPEACFYTEDHYASFRRILQ